MVWDRSTFKMDRCMTVIHLSNLFFGSQAPPPSSLLDARRGVPRRGGLVLVISSPGVGVYVLGVGFFRRVVHLVLSFSML